MLQRKALPLAILGVVGLFATPAGAVPIFNVGTGHWYDIVSSDASGAWGVAETNAVALGGHLVTVNDTAEQDWLHVTYPDVYWIGYTDAAAEGTWAWSSGEISAFTYWNGGEPNDSMPPDTGEDYAVINWGSAGEWNDWDHLREGYFHTDGIAEFDTNPVPEPATLLLLGAGLVGLGARRKRPAA